VVEGTIKLGGQEHFYLEPNGAIVVPTESDEFLLISSTQAPNKHQVGSAAVQQTPLQLSAPQPHTAGRQP
jgi:xanthine dehydrogenase/oxidase